MAEPYDPMIAAARARSAVRLASGVEAVLVAWKAENSPKPDQCKVLVGGRHRWVLKDDVTLILNEMEPTCPTPHPIR